MKRIARKYADFLRQPDVARLLWAALLARMPIGMVGFSMLMYLRETLGNFAHAGSALGAYFFAMAIFAPVLGRLIDRVGPRVPLLVTGIIQPLALAAVLAAAKLGLPFAFVATAAGLAGAFAAPITTLSRALWRYRFDNEDDRRIAFALDAVTIELNFALGPAIVAVVLATAGALAAFALSIVTALIGFLVYFFSPALAYFKRQPDVERHLLGPLTEPRLWVLFTATAGFVMCLGLIEVGYPAFATVLGVPAFGGILLSINSIGSALGGAVYGGLHFKSTVERQFCALLGLIAIPLFLHAIVTSPPLFACVAFFAGLVIAPTIAAQSVLVTRLAPAHYTTEAFTWSSSFILAGLGAGTALGGVLVETRGVPAAFATAGAIACAMALLALLLAPTERAHPTARAAD